MKSAKPTHPFTPLETRKFLMPISLASILVFAGLIVGTLFTPTRSSVYLVIYGVLGILYIIYCNFLMVRYGNLKILHKIINSLVIGIGLGCLSLALPESMSEVNHFLIVFSSVAIATISERRYAYLTLFTILAISLAGNGLAVKTIGPSLEYFTPVIVSVVVLEVINQLKKTAKQNIYKLETINKVSRQIMQSLDTKQTLSLLDATIQDTLEADTFFIGILEGDEISLELFYDDGEYYNETRAPMKGTLSGWVINNQKELFLPDMRDEVQLDGVEYFIMGKEKTSLSWIGVPLKAQNITGVLALASYTANAFDRADLELLINLGQHVTLALDNTIRHAQVEKQARLDSLTGVYNHGYFLKRLAEQAEHASQTDTHLSLIMLDIDYFKQYNDTYGHLVGDHVLQSLCTAIQQHIKQNDSVGRWGGEEFIISLPGADSREASLVARRISETLGSIRVEDRNQKAIGIPTVSQGIAVFPNEADEIYNLIDLADKRLYVAKERGRNQIESNTFFGDK